MTTPVIDPVRDIHAVTAELDEVYAQALADDPRWDLEDVYVPQTDDDDLQVFDPAITAALDDAAFEPAA